MSTLAANTAEATTAPFAPSETAAAAAAGATPTSTPVSESNPASIISESDAPDYETLAARFRPIFDKIAFSAIEREKNRRLPFPEVAELKAAGFTKLRIPKAYGGDGVTLPQLFRLLLELAEADSNLSHLFRGHFAFLEGRLNLADKAAQEVWFKRVVDGAILGYAMAERTAHTGGDCKLVKEGDRWYVEGTKYYSTGTIYADWVIVSVLDGEERASVAIPTTQKGVTRVDDWDGFGQRLTGSGTTVFDKVEIPKENVIRYFSASELFTHSYQKSFLQLILLTSITGAGRAALREGIEFVRPRTRTFGIPGKSTPKDDPLVQRVIGQVSSLVFSAESIIDTISNSLEGLYQKAVAGTASEADYVATEIKTYKAQQIIIKQILEATTVIFEVGGASATSESKRFDRHWRNVRTAASHNPAIHREKAIGDYILNGTVPDTAWRAAFQKKNPTPTTPVEEKPKTESEAPISESADACRT